MNQLFEAGKRESAALSRFRDQAIPADMGARRMAQRTSASAPGAGLCPGRRDRRYPAARAHPARPTDRTAPQDRSAGPQIPQLDAGYGCQLRHHLTHAIVVMRGGTGYHPPPRVRSIPERARRRRRIKTHVDSVVSLPSTRVARTCRRIWQYPKPAKPEPNRISNALRPRPYGLFLDDLPIHIRPNLPAARVQT
jgi:hypothetical protein